MARGVGTRGHRSPTRVRLSRAAGWRLPAGAASVAAPTKWSNPFRPARRSAEANALAVELYRRHLDDHPDLIRAAQIELVGRSLACWCPADLPCHADVLLEIANEPAVPIPPPAIAVADDRVLGELRIT